MAEGDKRKYRESSNVRADKGFELLAKSGLVNPVTIQALRNGRADERSPANMVELSLDHSVSARAFLAENDVEMNNLFDKLLDIPGTGKYLNTLKAAMKAAEDLSNGEISVEVTSKQLKSMVQLAMLPDTLTKLGNLLSTSEIEVHADLGKLREAYVSSGLATSLQEDIGMVINAARRSVASRS